MCGSSLETVLRLLTELLDATVETQIWIDGALAEGTYVQLRFTWEDLMFHRSAVLRQIERVLATRTKAANRQS